MIYELTVLERLDAGSEQSRQGIASDAKGYVAKLLTAFDIKILQHEYDGVQKLSFKIGEQDYAGYDYYEYEVLDRKATVVAMALDSALRELTRLDGEKAVLRHLIIRQMSPEEYKKDMC